MDKVTINDVARVAGVAKSTVSRVINNKAGVHPRTRDRVMGVIKQLGFSPNIVARSLKTNQRKQITLAVNDIRNPYYPEMAWIAEQVARSYDYRIILLNHYGKESEELAVIEESNEMQVDGVILSSINYPASIKKVIEKSNIPVSLIGQFGEDIPADIVYTSTPAGDLAMDHLIRIGRTRIAYAGGPMNMHRGRRYASYVNSLSSNLLRFDPALVYKGNDLSLQTGLDAARYFMELAEKPDAVYAGNDIVAIGLLHGLDQLGVRVPEDIAIVGIDNIKWSVITKPQISTVSTMSTEKIRLAAQMLMDRLENGQRNAPFKRICLEPRLIVRGSSLKIL